MIPAQQWALATRAGVVAEALTWQGTPWRHNAAVKGAGVDCAQFVLEIYVRCGLISNPTEYRPGRANYSRQWMLHRDEDVMLDWGKHHFKVVEFPLPGDAALWKIGRTYSHAGLVIDWPRFIHSQVRTGVVLDDGLRGEMSGYPVVFFSVFKD